MRTIALGVTPTGLAAAPDGSLWVAAGLSNKLVRVRANGAGGYDTNEITLGGTCCRGPATVAVSGHDVWVANAAGLRAFDTTTQTVGANVSGAGVAGIAAAPDGSVWTADGWETLTHVTAGRRTTVPVVAASGGAGRPTAVAYGYGLVWTTAAASGAAIEVDPGTEAAAAPIDVGRSPEAIATGAGAVWVANTGDGTVTRIDPAAARVVREIAVGQRVAALATMPRALWVAVEPRSAAADPSATVAYASWNGVAPITLSGLDVRPRRFLTSAAGSVSDHDPRWSPDGRLVVFTRTQAQGVLAGPTLASELFVVRANGRGLRPLTHGPAASAQPAWAPDGREIAFQRAPTASALDGGGAIWVMGDDGKRPHRVGPSCGATSPAWSPAGESILIACLAAPSRLETMRRDGSSVRAIPGPVEPTAFAWSPGGSVIAYATGAGGVSVVGVDGGPSARLANLELGGTSPVIHRLRWSPDGRRLLLSDSYGDMFVVFADGGGVTQVSAAAESPDWRPTP